MTGTWTLTCPNQGVYAGEGHVVKRGKGFQLHLKNIVKIKSPKEESCDAETPKNPRTREFLPHGLTPCEKKHPSVRHKLQRAIKHLEIKCCGKHTTDYSKCSCNPVAVARATIPCP